MTKNKTNINDEDAPDYSNVELAPQQTFVEETMPDGTYKVRFIGDFEECQKWMRNSGSKNRLEIWSQAWAATEFGHAPMAWRAAQK